MIVFDRPVIDSPADGETDIVNNGEDGYSISSYETEKIAQAVIELSKDEEKCMVLSKAARKRVEDLNEDIFEKKMIEVICE